MVGEAVEERGGPLGVAEDRGPLAEVCGDDYAGLLVELAEQVEQHGAARGTERQAGFG